MKNSSTGRILSLDLACYHAVKDYPGGVGAVAAVFGWNERTLQNKLNPTQMTHKLSAYEAEHILQLTDDPRILDSICHSAKACWLKIDDFEESECELGMVNSITEMVQRTAELAKEFQESLADNVVKPHEMKRLQYALFRLVQSGHGVLKHAEQHTD